jgi:hypothetical protein
MAGGVAVLSLVAACASGGGVAAGAAGNYPDPVNASQVLSDDGFVQVNAQMNNATVTDLAVNSASVATGLSGYPGPMQIQVVFFLKSSRAAERETRKAVAQFDSEGLTTSKIGNQLAVTGTLTEWHMPDGVKIKCCDNYTGPMTYKP